MFGCSPNPRDVQFPGFYDPSREFDDATIQFDVRRAAWAIPRSVNSCLMGAWTPSFALMWPLLWAVWPPLLFGVGRWSRAPDPGDSRATLRWRLAWFLTLAGCAGIAMHLLTFCYGYYLPPYLIASLMGVCLAMLDVPRGDSSARDRQRAAQMAGIGFAVAATLLTLRYVRTAEASWREANLGRGQGHGRGPDPFPHFGDWPPQDRGSQAGTGWVSTASASPAASCWPIFRIPTFFTIRSVWPRRWPRCVVKVSSRCWFPGDALRPDDHLQWQPIGSGAWTIVDVRANGYDESGQ